MEEYCFSAFVTHFTLAEKLLGHLPTICTFCPCIGCLQGCLGIWQGHWVHSASRLHPHCRCQTRRLCEQPGELSFHRRLLLCLWIGDCRCSHLMHPMFVFSQLKYKETYEKQKGHYLAGTQIDDFQNVVHSLAFQKIRSAVSRSSFSFPGEGFFLRSF